MNDAKSAPFAHTPYVKNPCIPPKISKSHNFGKLRENRSIRHPPVSNHAKFAQFLQKSHQSLLPNCTPIFCSKFREIRSLRKDSERLTRN